MKRSRRRRRRRVLKRVSREMRVWMNYICAMSQRGTMERAVHNFHLPLLTLFPYFQRTTYLSLHLTRHNSIHDIESYGPKPPKSNGKMPIKQVPSPS